MRKSLVIGAALAALAFAGTAQAAVTIHPVAVAGSSSYPGNPGYPDFDAIDGNAVTDWASNGDGTSTTLRIDLGSIYSLTSGLFVDRVTSGGDNGGFVGGTTDFTTAFSFASCTDFTCTTTGPALTFEKATPVNPSSPADFAFTADLGGLTGRYFLYSATATNGPNAGLSELSFSSPTPEPATWGMMLLGFGIAGSALRRRPAKVRAAIA